MKYILVIYVLVSYIVALIFWGFQMEYYFSTARQYEKNRLNLAVALAPILLPAGTAIMFGKALAEDDRGDYKGKKKNCEIRFGFCGPKK